MEYIAVRYVAILEKLNILIGSGLLFRGDNVGTHID